jgi:hypothetical protein
MPSSRCRPRSRSRICAWIVTSSAVVGSSAISSAACRRAPSRSSRAGACRPRAGADSRRGGARPGIRPARAARARFGARARAVEAAMVQTSALRDLVADREDRVQRRHRLLEDHRDVAPADLAHLVLGQRHVGVARCRAADAAGSTEHSAVMRLPEPDSPTTPRISGARSKLRTTVRRRQVAHRERTSSLLPQPRGRRRSRRRWRDRDKDRSTPLPG